MRLSAIGALLGARVALGAALPAEANQLAQHSASSPEIQKMHDSVDEALSTMFTAAEKAKIKAAVDVGMNQLKNQNGQPRKGLDQGLSNVLTDADVERLNVAADATVKAASRVVARDVAEKRSSASFTPMPLPTSASQCDCSALAFGIDVVAINLGAVNAANQECMHLCTFHHEKRYLDQFPQDLRSEKASQVSHSRNLVLPGLVEKAVQNLNDAPTNRLPKELAENLKHASHTKRSDALESSEAKTPAFTPPTLTKTAQCDCTKLLTIACGDQDHYSVQRVYGQKCVDECTKKLDDKLQKDFQIQDYPSPKPFISHKTASRQMSPDCHDGCPKMLLASFTDPEHKTAGAYDAKCILGCRSVLQEKLDKGVVDVKPWKQHHHDEVAPPTSLTKRGGRDEAEYDEEKQKGRDDEFWQHPYFDLHHINPTVDTMFGKMECNCKSLYKAAQTRYESITHHDSKYHRFKTKVWYRHNKKCLEACDSAAKQGLGLTTEDLNPDNRPPLQ